MRFRNLLSSRSHFICLWNGKVDSNIKEAHQVTLYWHWKLWHAPLVFLCRLSFQGVLPACIQKIFAMPLCAACSLDQAHRRNWQLEYSLLSSICAKSMTKPRSDTSADHLVSKYPGLIPQYTGILTHECFWGSVIFVDHFSDLVYSHLIPNH